LVLEYQRDPGRLKIIVENLSPSNEWIITDEVQKVPELLDVVHDLNESTDKKFAITGSSARKLKRGADS
jgi:predicted AAA+ superfamily ATPase